MAKPNDALVEAFYNTKYCVEWQDGCVSNVFLNKPLPLPVIQWLQSVDAQTYAVVTADNPHAQTRPEIDNIKARKRLKSVLAQQQLPYQPTRHVALHGDWPDEIGCLIGAITQTEAIALGRRFGQCAVITGTIETTPTLVFIDEYK